MCPDFNLFLIFPCFKNDELKIKSQLKTFVSPDFDLLLLLHLFRTHKHGTIIQSRLYILIG